MSKILNTVTLHEGHAEILVEKTGNSSYRGKVLLDIEDIAVVGKVRITQRNYVYMCNAHCKAVHHVVLGHDPKTGLVVDHINGNPLDNRKHNLRVVTLAENANNRTKPRNNTGIVGITLRKNGKYEYYRATCSDRITPTHSKAKSQTKRYSKQFNINKLGKEVAFSQAQEWIKQKKREFGYL